MQISGGMNAIPAKITDYPSLRQEISNLLEHGRLQAMQAVSRIANRTWWQIGKRLDRAAGGDGQENRQLIERLSADLRVSPSLLYHALRFFRAWPRGLPRRPDAAALGFGAHLLLLPVADPRERLFYIERALAEGWSRARLRQALRSGLYRQQLEAGSTPDAPPPLERPAPGLHTYTGIVEKVVDGDTLDVRIDLGFDVWRVERLRLRGIDAPEMNTPAGRAAREFVERALAGCELVAFRTYKTDIYARYIADVFYDPAARERTAIVTQGRFLNQELLDAGQAVRAYW